MDQEFKYQRQNAKQKIQKNIFMSSGYGRIP